MKPGASTQLLTDCRRRRGHLPLSWERVKTSGRTLPASGRGCERMLGVPAAGGAICWLDPLIAHVVRASVSGSPRRIVGAVAWPEFGRAGLFPLRSV